MVEYEDIEKLQEYSEMEGNELGDACRILCQLNRFCDYLSDEFVAALEKEFYEQLQNFTENTEIIERKVERTIIETIVELKWRK